MGVEFPRVVCDAHPHAEPRPGWVVCVHVLDDVTIPIAHLSTPTALDLGQILCHGCYVAYRIERLRLLCVECVDDVLRARELMP